MHFHLTTINYPINHNLKDTHINHAKYNLLLSIQSRYDKNISLPPSSHIHSRNMKSDGLLNGKPVRHTVVSEWEDNILFDADDPDFRSSSTSLATGQHTSAAVLNALLTKGEKKLF